MIGAGSYGKVSLLGQNDEQHISHGRLITRGDGSHIDSLAEIMSLDPGWDALECDFGIVAIYKLDPLVLAIAYNQNIGNRYRNLEI